MSTNLESKVTLEKTENVKVERKRSWFSWRKILITLFVLLAVLSYFCLVPSRLIISPETTLITQLNSEGKPDYAGVFMQEHNGQLKNPDDNGFRMVVEKFGPYILEQASLMNACVWEDLPNDKTGMGKWYHETWVPLCNAMSIDPAKKPTEYKSIHSKMDKTGKEEYKKTDLRNALRNKAWRAEDYPDIAQFVRESDEVLTIYAAAVKKPQWVCYRTANNGLIAVLLPDIQSSRAICTDFAIRANERVGRGDIAGAFDDALSIFRIARHQTDGDDGMIVTRLVGFAVEGVGMSVMQSILTYGKPSAEQIRHFINELDKIPKYNKSIDNVIRLEKMIELEVLFDVQKFIDMVDYVDWSADSLFSDSYLAGVLFQLSAKSPIDYNIAAKRIQSRFEPLEKMSKEYDLRKRMEMRDQMELDTKKLLTTTVKNPTFALSQMPLIRQRSALLADYITCLMFPAVSGFITAEARLETQRDMLRVSFALELYQRENGQYPDKLEALVPKYISVIPDDIFAPQKLTYKKNDNGYILYSFGRNKIDDNGDAKQEKDIVVERKIDVDK
ncbi:MAG: hypothetical protein LBQ66_13305 [Planctomycetaceae bacterium]|jgi:hypothetical protein|nr:hypothetical protein [Planctomycetaceae bacterium]